MLEWTTGVWQPAPVSVRRHGTSVVMGLAQPAGGQADYEAWEQCPWWVVQLWAPRNASDLDLLQWRAVHYLALGQA